MTSPGSNGNGSAVLVPTVTISSGGRPLPTLATSRVTQVSLTRRMDPPDNFSIDLFDPDLTLVSAPDGPFREGAALTVQVGFAGGGTIGISGTVAAVVAEFPADGNPVVRVDGFDPLHALTRGSAYRVFPGPGDVGASDSDVVSRLAAEAGLAVAADPGRPRRLPPVQDHVSDLAFLRELAAAGGYSIWVDQRQALQFRSTRTPAPTVELRRGDDLLSLRLRLSTAGQVASVLVQGWDPVQKQAFTATAGRAALAPEASTDPTGGAGRTLLVAHANVSTVDEARSLAEAIMADQGQALVVGTGTTVGRPDLDVGAVVSLRGAGRFDAGRYVLTEATHTVGADGYRTEFQLNGAPGSGGLFEPGGGPGQAGPAVGVTAGVVTDNRDPLHRGRVKVRRAAAPDGEFWARLVAPAAGPDSGSFLMPEAGDEVLLAFEHGHPDRPYVLGAVWNGTDAPPATEPSVRVLKSRTGHLVRLDDTAGKERIELIEKDGRSSVVLDSVSGAITVRGGADVTVEAPNGVLRLQGNQIAMTATTGLSVKSDGTLDLAGGGPATLRGATVDIN
ncbi:MAG TPA: phage baseplate assembly protein V [Mycobacteriales bacterium]|nr:phage baseplate assembly protein V [Mycobacteriales bacterium]